jgi:hypothetical protein
MQLIIFWNSVKQFKKYLTLRVDNSKQKTWRTCDFPGWERVKHIVSVYNAHPSYQIKNLGKKLRIMQP